MSNWKYRLKIMCEGKQIAYPRAPQAPVVGDLITINEEEFIVASRSWVYGRSVADGNIDASIQIIILTVDHHVGAPK